MDFGANDRDKEKKNGFQKFTFNCGDYKAINIGGWEAEVSLRNSLRNSVPERGLPVTGKDLSRA